MLMLPDTLQKAPSSPCLFINTLSKCVQWDTFRHLTHFNRDMPCLRLACSLRIKFLAHFPSDISLTTEPLAISSP